MFFVCCPHDRISLSAHTDTQHTHPLGITYLSYTCIHTPSSMPRYILKVVRLQVQQSPPPTHTHTHTYSPLSCSYLHTFFPLSAHVPVTLTLGHLHAIAAHCPHTQRLSHVGTSMHTYKHTYSLCTVAYTYCIHTQLLLYVSNVHRFITCHLPAKHAYIHTHMILSPINLSCGGGG